MTDDPEKYRSLLEDCSVLQVIVQQCMERQKLNGFAAFDATQRALSGISQFPWDELKVDEAGRVTPRTKSEEPPPAVE